MQNVLQLADPGSPSEPKLGVELGCISASAWTPYQYLDWFRQAGIEAAQFTFGTLGMAPVAVDEAELRRIRAHAQSRGVRLFRRRALGLPDRECVRPATRDCRRTDRRRAAGMSGA